jgi:hypothetical protein
MTLETHTFDDDGSIPNSTLPVLIYCDLLVVGAYRNGTRTPREISAIPCRPPVS